MKKILLFLMFALLCIPWVANAQQSLPYSYGFETTLAAAGWTSTCTSSNTGMTTDPVHGGSYAYAICYNEGADRYLMSPLFTGADRGVDVTFYYKSRSTTYPDQFQVGYTTDETVTDPAAFTYGETISEENAEWTEYSNTFPAGTKRIAIKYLYNSGNGWYLYLDDFTFEAHSNCAKPTDLAIDYTEGASRATVTWSGEATSSYNVMVNGVLVAEGLTETTYAIRGIELVNNYTVSVQADCGEEQSGWVSETFFSGCTETFAIPYAYGFENTADINCWTLSPADNMVIDETNNAFAHNGNNFFTMNYTQNPPQYLISPELSGIVNGLHVEFYYSRYTQGEETFHVGYSITDNDPESFTWGDEITASTAYQRFSANYPAETKYVAIKHTSDYQWYLFLDDFLFEESASCLEPTNVQYADVTTTGATISWTAGGEEEAWDIYVTDNYEDVPDESTTPTYANVDNNTSYAIGNLDPASTYYVYIRAICGENETSAWGSPAIFNTQCEGMALPYTEDFENDLSVCWTIINDNTSYNSIGLNTLPHNGDLALGFNTQSDEGNLIAVLPVVDGATYPLNNAQVSFWVRHYSTSSYASACPFAVGIMTDPNDPTTFVQMGETITPTTTYTQYTVRLNSYTGEGQYIAFKSTPNSTYYSIYTFIDDIEVSVLPSCLEPTDLTVSGGKNAVVTWEGDAASFDVAIATSEVEDPADYIVGNTEDNEFDLSSYTSVGMNYVYVRANCGTEGYSEWVSTSFDVNYCTPNPTSHDGSGITGVSFGTGDYVVTNGDGSASLPASAPFYGDYTSMIGAVQAGVESTIAITTGTGNYPYTFVIWVDLDNSMSFEDSEILYIGKAASGAGTLNATITIPATQTVGDYRMRIYGADSYFTSFYGNGTTNWDAAHDPCAAGSYRHAHDYTLRVLEAPSCLAAADVTVAPENITSTSAVISWTNNNGADATYTVMQGETVLTTDAVNSYTLEGLTAATTYPAGTFTIISDCDETAVANVPAFTTLCDDITTLPWSEDFEGFANNTVPLCWDNSASTSSTVNTSPYYIWGVVTVSDNNMMKMENYWAQSGTALINTPTIVLPAEGTYQLSFDYAHNASCGAFAVNVSTDNGATFTELASYTKGSGSSHTEPEEFTPTTISLADYAGESIILQFFANANYGNGAIFVDNITVAEIPAPACDKIVLEAPDYTRTFDFEDYEVTTTTHPFTFVTPDCWEVAYQYTSASINHIGEEADTLPQLYRSFNHTQGGQYSLRMKYRSILAMPELDETVDFSRLHLSMYVRQPQTYYKLEVGIMEDLEDESTFTPIALVNNSTKTMTYFECGFSSYDGNGRYIAFRNVGGTANDPYCSNYLDDIVLSYVDEEACTIGVPYFEDFEGLVPEDLAEVEGGTGVEPECWEMFTEDVAVSSINKPQLYAGFDMGEEPEELGDYTLRLKNRCVYAMPALSSSYDIHGLTMTFSLRQAKLVYRLQVGVLDADNNFDVVKTFNFRPENSVQRVFVDFADYEGEGNRIAFRNTLGHGSTIDYSTNFIDDIYVDETSKIGNGAGNAIESEDMNAYLESIDVYPNPTTGLVQIEAVDVQKVECYSAMGQLVGVYENVNELNLGEFADGVYMLRITVPQGVTMRKVVKR